MEYEFERKIRLSKESGGLQEFDESGNQIGLDQFSWLYSLSFTATYLRYWWTIERKRDYQDSIDDNAGSVVESECITGQLRPDETVYSMFGTGRIINRIILRIENMADDDSIEYCSVWACGRYAFEGETQDDLMEVTVHLSPSRFERLAKQVRAKEVDRTHLILRKVSGFYSEEVYGVTTSHIKVLAQEEGQKILGADDAEKTLRRLGEVSEFQLITTTGIEFSDGQCREKE